MFISVASKPEYYAARQVAAEMKQKSFYQRSGCISEECIYGLILVCCEVVVCFRLLVTSIKILLAVLPSECRALDLDQSQHFSCSGLCPNAVSEPISIRVSIHLIKERVVCC